MFSSFLSLLILLYHVLSLFIAKLCQLMMNNCHMLQTELVAIIVGLMGCPWGDEDSSECCGILMTGCKHCRWSRQDGIPNGRQCGIASAGSSYGGSSCKGLLAGYKKKK